MKITKIYPALILFFILLSGCIEFNDSNYTSDSSYSSYDKYNFIPISTQNPPIKTPVPLGAIAISLIGVLILLVRHHENN